DHDCGAVVKVNEPAGHDADHAGMPALAAKDNRASLARAALGPDHLLRFLNDLELNLLPAAVDQVKLLSNLQCLRGIVASQHGDGPHRLLEPAGRIDSRR